MTAAPSWYVISLRPRGEHDTMRRAAARYGAGLIALSPWRLQFRDDRATRSALRAALAASRLIFTSPVAVRAAHQLQAFKPRRGQLWCAVGAGTAAALHRAGVDDVQAPARMDSEGLLALPALQDLRSQPVGLITAPGGRGEIAPALLARGAEVLRVEVYAREPLALAPRALQRLRMLDAPAVLALSSGEALQLVLTQLSDDLAARLRAAHVVAASARLAALAREQGFPHVTVAAGPQPRDLLAAAASLSGSMGS